MILRIHHEHSPRYRDSAITCDLQAVLCNDDGTEWFQLDTRVLGSGDVLDINLPGVDLSQFIRAAGRPVRILERPIRRPVP